MLKEWPLVAFTIAGQMAVGAFLFLFPPLFLSSAGTAWDSIVRGWVLVLWGMTLGLVAAAAALSFFHLHHPFRAHRVLANLRTSWLSREIFFELAFMALVALAFVLVWTDHTTGLFLRAVMAAAALAAILFLVSMCRVYMLESVPPWDSVYTGASFFLTAATLGAMATAWVTEAPLVNSYSNISWPWTASLVFVAADGLVAVLLTPQYGIAGFRSRPSLRPLSGAHRVLYLVRLALLAGGLFLIVLAMSNRESFILAVGVLGPVEGSGSILAVAFVMVLFGEVANRFLFYGLAPRPGD